MKLKEKSRQNIIISHPSARESLIPILQEIQEDSGYISRQSIEKVSCYLKLPESKIYGVATFYNQFKLKPPGKNQIQICRGTACHVKGSFDLLTVLKIELGIEVGETTKDGLFSLDTVACLGCCSIAPVIKINENFYGRLDKKKVTKVIEELKNEESSHE
jgi:NADH-quinone oxidoreductase subunit E